MKITNSLAFGSAALLLASLSACSEKPAGQASAAVAQPHGAAAGHGDHQQEQPTDPVSAAFLAANDKMHRDMAVNFTGNADRDFVQAMIPHHQGAVEMAKIALQHGKDSEVRKLAEEVIRTQEAEIRLMRGWLERDAAAHR
jgi:predicted outer membrane protein